MIRAGQRKWRITFERAVVTIDGYGQEVEGSAIALASAWARIKFGTAQEKREAAQEGGAQVATFECVTTPTLQTVTLKDRIIAIGSEWDITEIAPLDRHTIRFTAVRSV